VSQENVEIVRRNLQERTTGSGAAWVATWDPDVEWDLSAYPLPDWPDRGRGREALLGHRANYLAGWLSYESEIRELIDAGDDVVAIMREHVRLRESGASLGRDQVQVWTVRDGLMCRMRIFKTRDEALKAVGLAE
jgi:ketosteroid isomerase-like protein